MPKAPLSEMLDAPWMTSYSDRGVDDTRSRSLVSLEAGHPLANPSVRWVGELNRARDKKLGRDVAQTERSTSPSSSTWSRLPAN